MNKWVVALSAALALGHGAVMAGDAAAGKAKSAMCAACHGADGNSTNPIWPVLAGQHEGYIAKQLADFKAHNRTDPTMMGMAAPMSETDMANLAAYFSSQTPKGGAAAPDAVAAGEKVYRTGSAKDATAACIACHGPTGAGNPAAKYPRLAGQHATYIEKALKDFRSGTRANDLNGMMRGVASKLSDDEIKAVAQYVQGLK